MSSISLLNGGVTLAEVVEEIVHQPGELLRTLPLFVLPLLFVQHVAVVLLDVHDVLRVVLVGRVVPVRRSPHDPLPMIVVGCSLATLRQLFPQVVRGSLLALSCRRSRLRPSSSSQGHEDTDEEEKSGPRCCVY